MMAEQNVRVSYGSKSVWRKLYAGGNLRKSRFHDELGKRIRLRRVLRNAPRALVTGAARLFLGRRPERPWISYDAQVEIARFLNPKKRVLEFGSGMSTVWYARRSGMMVSIEDNASWFDAIGSRLREFDNVEYRFAPTRESYLAAANDETFDFIMIDGGWRDDCARYAITHLSPGGIIYLDNSDKGACPQSGNVPEAVRILSAFAAKEGLRSREFVDFAPTQLFVERGLMVGG